jgi:hypothetical protein
MITLKPYMGVALVLIGALLLIVSYVAGWTSSNLVLLGGLLIVILGVIMHVRLTKAGQKY